MTSSFLTTGFWLLSCFLVFFFLFGHKIKAVFLKVVDDKVDEIKELITGVEHEKKAAYSLLDDRKKELQKAIKDSNEVLKTSKEDLKALSDEYIEEIKQMEQRKAEALERRLAQLSEHFQEVSKKKATELYKKSVINLLSNKGGEIGSIDFEYALEDYRRKEIS